MGQGCCKGQRGKSSVVSYSHPESASNNTTTTSNTHGRVTETSIIGDSPLTESIAEQEVVEAPDELKNMKEYSGLAPRRIVIARV
eukprot:m.16684 g.16684  ORF g.16684 m.16684 type:complete len:85 (+) comp8038_c0_seq1:29-283(+)